MIELNPAGPGVPASARRILPALLILFFGSGCAALIYEIVWFQLLQLVVGSSAVSLGVLLGTFMGGMCLGSLALPRLVSARRHPLVVYAWLELGIGVIGLLVLLAAPYVGRVYLAVVGHGLPGILLRGLVAAICLLPPTLLMGATLPAMARWIETTPRGVSWLGFFYGGNIAGAVSGCLLAGFYLLRVHDLRTATWVAVGINVAVAVAGFGLAAFAPYVTRPVGVGQADGHRNQGRKQKPEPATGVDESHAGNVWNVYAAIALSGMCALGAEVVWTRLLSLIIGGTVYTFSIILAVFLTGLGLGSSVGSFLSRTVVRPRLALGWCQVLLAAGMAWTAVMISQSLPYWPVDPSLSKSPWFNFQIDLARCLWAVLPPTLLWGASFPLALAAVASRGQDPGRLVGGVYAANTVGAIVGALGTSVLLIPWLGTQDSQRVLAGASVAAALVVAGPVLWRMLWAKAGGGRRPVVRFAGTVLVSCVLALAGLLVWKLPRIPWGLVAYGRYLPSREGESSKLFLGEGMNSSVAVTEMPNGVRNFHVSGKVEASSEPQDMRLQRMLGHLPALLHPKPRSVLIVGCGAGVTAGTFVLHPGIERIVICEIEPLIPRVVARHFAGENYGVLDDPRVEVVYDDGRHYILTTREKFDIITSDPIHPWIRGSATLYSKDYFELVREHLNPSGVVTQWVPLYESNRAAVKSELATFFEVFPAGTIWGNDDFGEGYDAVLLGQAGPTRIDVDGLHQRLGSLDYLQVSVSLSEASFKSAVDLLATYAGCAMDLAPWLEGAEINRDRNLRLQYLAGLGANLYQSEAIYSEMLEYRRYPEELFVTSDEREQALRKLLDPRPKKP